MANTPEAKDPENAIEEVERLRERLARGQTTRWSLTGWRTVDWLLAALVLAFVLYVLVPHD